MGTKKDLQSQVQFAPREKMKLREVNDWPKVAQLAAATSICGNEMRVASSVLSLMPQAVSWWEKAGMLRICKPKVPSLQHAFIPWSPTAVLLSGWSHSICWLTSHSFLMQICCRVGQHRLDKLRFWALCRQTWMPQHWWCEVLCAVLTARKQESLTLTMATNKSKVLIVCQRSPRGVEGGHGQDMQVAQQRITFMTPNILLLFTGFVISPRAGWGTPALGACSAWARPDSRHRQAGRVPWWGTATSQDHRPFFPPALALFHFRIIPGFLSLKWTTGAFPKDNKYNFALRVNHLGIQKIL